MAVKSGAKKPIAKKPEKVASGWDFSHLLPPKLSPSRMSDYQQCPKLFYYKTILGLSTPATFATCKGTLAHYAFEKVFDHPRQERTVEKALPYVREHWEEIKDSKDYEPLIEKGPEAIEEMLVESENLVKKWFLVENPTNFDPEERELYVRAQMAGIEFHGYIDRLDKITDKAGNVRWIISDYKTGKPQKEPYLEKAFFAMNVYALLLNKMQGVEVSKLRLIYVQNGKKDDVVGQLVDEKTLKKTERKLQRIWRGIEQNAKSGSFRAEKGPLCMWCHFKSECPVWAEELVNMPILNKNGEPYPR
jgi:putative RecB family exonuclease